MELSEFVNSLVTPKLLSLGEVIDSIEHGMFAYSTANEDKGLCISVNDYGHIYGFYAEEFNDVDKDGLFKCFYNFSLKKADGQSHRFFLFNNAEDYFHIKEENE